MLILPLLNKKNTALLISLTLVCTFSYVVFLGYRPKVLNEVPEVKGYRAPSVINLPYIPGSKELNVSRTTDNVQVTLETEKSSEDVQSFYKNVLLGKGWEIEYEGIFGIFLRTKYKSIDQEVVISSSNQESTDTTIVMLEVSKR
jgi:hypothetical protein